jgi:beta-mannosidase
VPEPSLPTTGDPTWDHLGRWWNNEPLVREAFGGGIEDIATLSRASQFLQADALRYAVEASRRRPESCGVLPWQFNESFPNGWCTCAVDYFGEPKAAYHYVRRSYRPLHACARLPAPRVTGEELTATVWAWAPHDAPGSVAARAVLLDGRQVAQARWDVRVGTPRAVGEIRCPLNGRPFLLEVTASAGGRSSANRYLLTAAAGFGELLRLPPARVSTKLSASGEEWTLRLRHEAGPVAPFLRLLDARPAGHSGWMRWDDNAIDLLPGEERVLRCRWDGVAPEDRRVRLDGWNVRGEVRQWT